MGEKLEAGPYWIEDDKVHFEVHLELQPETKAIVDIDCAHLVERSWMGGDHLQRLLDLRTGEFTRSFMKWVAPPDTAVKELAEKLQVWQHKHRHKHYGIRQVNKWEVESRLVTVDGAGTPLPFFDGHEHIVFGFKVCNRKGDGKGYGGDLAPYYDWPGEYRHGPNSKHSDALVWFRLGVDYVAHAGRIAVSQKLQEEREKLLASEGDKVWSRAAKRLHYLGDLSDCHLAQYGWRVAELARACQGKTTDGTDEGLRPYEGRS